jgi:hypothetical protein
MCEQPRLLIIYEHVLQKLSTINVIATVLTVILSSVLLYFTNIFQNKMIDDVSIIAKLIPSIWIKFLKISPT